MFFLVFSFLKKIFLRKEKMSSNISMAFIIKDKRDIRFLRKKKTSFN
uniref:Uncharacterized protein n=1 Tax=viral metagenome TaxID=1070528 RepID=A0A6C0AEK6_9ZZZZ